MTLKVDRQHRVLEYYKVYSNNDPGLTLTYFMARSNFVPYDFVWEDSKRVHEAYEYQCQGHLLTLIQISDSIFVNFLSSITTRPIEAKFHVEPP